MTQFLTYIAQQKEDKSGQKRRKYRWTILAIKKIVEGYRRTSDE